MVMREDDLLLTSIHQYFCIHARAGMKEWIKIQPAPRNPYAQQTTGRSVIVLFAHSKKSKKHNDTSSRNTLSTYFNSEIMAPHS